MFVSCDMMVIVRHCHDNDLIIAVYARNPAEKALVPKSVLLSAQLPDVHVLAKSLDKNKNKSIKVKTSSKVKTSVKEK